MTRRSRLQLLARFLVSARGVAMRYDGTTPSMFRGLLRFTSSNFEHFLSGCQFTCVSGRVPVLVTLGRMGTWKAWRSVVDKTALPFRECMMCEADLS